MKFEVDINDYLSKDEIRDIAISELRQSFRSQLRNESDIERIIVNLSYEYVQALINEQWDGELSEILKDRIRSAIESSTSFYVFRGGSDYEKESPAMTILKEECKNSRPLIRKCIEKHIKEYSFSELDRDEIGSVIYDVIMDKILAPRTINEI